MNGRPLFLLIIACGLTLGALVTRKGELLALSLPFLAFVLVAWLHSPDAPVLTASRRTDKSSASEGEWIQMLVVLKAMGDGTANLRMQDTLPVTSHVVAGQSGGSFLLAAGEVADLKYTFAGRRSICLWDSIDVVASDPLGLFERRLQVEAPGEVVILPKTLVLQSFPFRPRRTLHSAGPIPVPLAGSGTDFLGIREYRAGDALRHINWRLAARHPGRLFTNEHERHEVGDFGIVVDARQVDDDVFEAAVSAAASLAQRILRDGNRLSLLVFGRSMNATFPGYGKRQLSLVLRSLAGARRSASVPLDYLEYFPARLFPSQAVLVIVSSPGPNDAEVFAKLRAAGYEVLLISPDPIGYAARKQSSDGRGDMGVRAARIERRATLLRLSQLGIHIVDWQLSRPIGAVLEAVGSHVVHRRNLPT